VLDTVLTLHDSLRDPYERSFHDQSPPADNEFARTWLALHDLDGTSVPYCFMASARSPSLTSRQWAIEADAMGWRVVGHQGAYFLFIRVSRRSAHRRSACALP
jgi:hypothetical protein